eukprot:CAMPEP_0118645948 /NCGR_PEP_ID=MMETSP0785-20121206/7781_1 /TAXON_ID=91992 /ORGANISM="Bolidomonas pacifica, Strain CCMP 1866" /LENGTH=653 /DNA_ID=CAMNT_0006537881 /DNA_START=133 /DNA_END=2094 /DNA_ORIENTATION=-
MPASSSSPLPSPIVRTSSRPQTVASATRPKVERDQLTGTLKLIAPKERKHEMATYQPSKIPHPKFWNTETRDKLGKGEYHDNYEYLDLAKQKEEFIKHENDKIMFNKARKKLANLAQTKFGDIKNMFKMFDYDNSGTVSLEEFSRGLKRRNLEAVFGREQQRCLFEYIDKDNNEQLDVQEFIHFLSPQNDDLDGLKTSRSSMSKYGRPEKKKKEKKMDPAVQRVKDMIVDRLVARRRMHKMDDSQQMNSEYLIQVFKQWDESMTGYLTPDEFTGALGEKHMNLGIARVDMDKVLNEIDADHNGEISYKEFAKFVQVHDIDPEYNPFYDSRQRALNKLERIANKPWQWQKETDNAIAHQRATFKAIEADNAATKKHREMIQRQEEASIPKGETNMMNKSRSHSVSGERDKSTVGLAPENIKATLKKVNSSAELFEEMRAKKAEQLAGICPRFRPLPPTDWTRTGCGGDGVNPNAGGYYQPMTMSTTTTNDYYPPLFYVPNQPIRRALKSDAQKGFEEKKFQTVKRKKRTDANFRVIMERVKRQEQMEHMNKDQKLKEKSQQMLRYYKQIYAMDAKLQKKAGFGFESKKHPEFAHRMWGGTTESPFHVSHMHKKPPVLFRTTSSDFGAHSAKRISNRDKMSKSMSKSSSVPSIFA